MGAFFLKKNIVQAQSEVDDVDNNKTVCYIKYYTAFRTAAYTKCQ
jgi:hypothetical protein